MSKRSKRTRFYAIIQKGYIPKVIFDAIATNITRIPITVSPTGMLIRVADRDEMMYASSLWDINFKREHFTHFDCNDTFTFTLNVKQLGKMLKSIKKKDTLIFSIPKDRKKKKDDSTAINQQIKRKKSSKLVIVTKSNSSTEYTSKADTIEISIKFVDTLLPPLPDKGKDDKGNDINGFEHPMIICASDIQKIKKMSSIDKTKLNIVMQKHRYLAFKSATDTVLGNKSEHGKLSMNVSDESSEETDSDQDIDLEEYPHIYIKEFDMSLFSPLIKLPGSCTQMSFYCPLYDNFPLKISMTTIANVATITYYIKDKSQIVSEEKLKK